MRRVLGALVVFVLAVGLGGYAYLRRSLPVVDGTIAVTGTSGTIEIIRDADAVPHVFATTARDAFYGLGYVHAQDRLWQMEFQRRVGNGRLSEIFGLATLPADRFLRTVGFGRAATSAWEHLPADTRADINAYIAGINQFLATHHRSALPPEFQLLGFEPEPWTGPDVLAWQKMMAWDLSANYSIELMRHDLAAKVGEARMRELLPAVAPDALSILPTGWNERAAASSTEAHSAELRAAHARAIGTPDESAADSRYATSAGGGIPQPPASPAPSWYAALAGGLATAPNGLRALLLGGTAVEDIGSNNWVVDGTMTASGKPLLANDPHLTAQAPSVWYLAHMTGGDLDVIGATLPGTPVVAIGRNRFVAWGETNVAADVEDLYREKLDDTGTRAEFRGVLEPLRIVTEVVNVKGQAPVRVDVRISRHGPLVSDAINANNASAEPAARRDELEPLAFRWTALDDEDTTIVAFLQMNRARNWTDFTAAMAQFVVPSQNFVYADVEGHIGYYAPGRIPVRASGDGSLPADGWTGDAEWTGWLPFDALPHAYDPPQHYIVTANNSPKPFAEAPFLTFDFPEPYRARRITELLTTSGPLTPDAFRAIQSDTYSLHAETLLPLLLQHVHPTEFADQQAVDVLRAWDLNARGDAAAPAIFEAWFLRLAPVLAGDELGALALDSYQGRYSPITRFIVNTLASDPRGWCDDVTTPARETCDDRVTLALHQAVAQLTSEAGGQPKWWRWDRIHHATFPHQGLDAVGLLRPFVSRAIGNCGDWSTVNVGPVDAGHPFTERELSSYREILDLSPANDNRFIDPLGESGHPLSPHYDDYLPDWHALRHHKARMDRADVEMGATGRLRLAPR